MWSRVYASLTERKAATYKKEPTAPRVWMCPAVHPFPTSFSPSATLSSVEPLSGVFRALPEQLWFVVPWANFQLDFIFENHFGVISPSVTTQISVG
jgi:hypothetical protein